MKLGIAGLRRAHERLSRAVPGSALAAFGSFRSSRRLGGHAPCAPGDDLAILDLGNLRMARSAASRWFGLLGCSRPAWARRSAFRFHNAAPLILAPLIPLGCLAFLRHDARGIWIPLSVAVDRRRAWRRSVLHSALPGIDHDSAGGSAGGRLAARACRSGRRGRRCPRCLEPIVRLSESAHRLICGTRRLRLGAKA